VWNVAPPGIGLTAAQVTAFKTLSGTARTNFNAQLAAQTAAKAATTTSQATIKSLRTNAGELLKFIKAYALTQSNPATVYAAAQIPPPAVPTPAAPPGTPTAIKAVLNTDGGLTLSWKCDNPNPGNVIYNVRRKDGDGAGATFDFVGATGTRKFIDDTVPSGVASVQYMIQAQRGQNVGTASNALTVYFGVSGPGLSMSITGTSETPMAQAA
jgi:hypothetical protein